MAQYKFELFGRLKKGAPPTPAGVPIERVRGMLAQGIAEADIISALKAEGYSFEQIDEALTKATMAAAPTAAPAAPAAAAPYPGAPAGAPPAMAAPPGFVTPPEAREAREELLPLEAPALPEEAPRAEQLAEELIEQLVQERMAGLTDKFKDIEERFRSTAGKLDELTARINAVGEQVKEASTALRRDMADAAGKVAEIEPRVTSLERAFKEIIPNLVDTVREVRELVIRARIKTEEARPAEF